MVGGGRTLGSACHRRVHGYGSRRRMPLQLRVPRRADV